MKTQQFFIVLAVVTVLFAACHKEPTEPKEKPKDPIPATDVTLNTNALTLLPGDTVALMATVQPDSADNKTVIWKSSDTSVATVTDNGLVTAIANGKATITATTQDGGKPATCNVTVDYRAQWVGEWDFEVERYYGSGWCSTIYSLGIISSKNANELKIEYGQNFKITAKVDEFGILSNFYPMSNAHGQFTSNDTIEIYTQVSYIEDGINFSFVIINGTKKKGNSNE